MIGTWHCLRILQTSWKASPLPTKHFIQTSISISNQCVVQYSVFFFFSYQSLQTSCRGDRHSALSLAPCRPAYGKVKKRSAAQTMCFCCLFLSVLLGWCSSCPTDNVFWSEKMMKSNISQKSIQEEQRKMWKISVVSNDMFSFDFIENVCRSTVFEMYGSPLENLTFNIGKLLSKKLQGYRWVTS